MLFLIGQRPGAGTYLCVKCGRWSVTLHSHDEALPPCENCGIERDVKYRTIVSSGKSVRPFPESLAVSPTPP